MKRKIKIARWSAEIDINEMNTYNFFLQAQALRQHVPPIEQNDFDAHIAFVLSEGENGREAKGEKGVT